MKKPAVILAMVVLGAGSVYLWQQLRAERAHSASLEERLKTLESAQASLPGIPSLLEPVTTSSAAQPATSPADTPATPPGEKPQRTTITVGNDMVKELFSTPEGRAQVLPTLRAVLATQFPDLAKALNLTPQEADKLLDLLARQRMDQTANAMGGTADAASRQEQQRQSEEKQRAYDGELQAMLGNKYPQWQEYQDTLPGRQQVSQLQTLLNGSGNPLNETQASRLITALSADQKRVTQETQALMQQGGNPRDILQQQLQRTTDNNRRLLDTASAYLNPQQLDSYQRMLDQQQNMTRMILRANGGSGATSGQGSAGGQAGATTVPN